MLREQSDDNSSKNPKSSHSAKAEVRGRPYWPRIPDGEYLALCSRTHWDRNSRTYGERIYIYFCILEGPQAGTELRMICRPSGFPTSNYYRAWSIAHDGPPRSRHTRLSHRIFVGKVFGVRTATVRPRHRITGPDGKARWGDFLPKHLWYSKIESLLSLEVTNEHLLRSAAIPNGVTEVFTNSFDGRRKDRGRVGRRESGAGNGVAGGRFQERRGGTSADNRNPVGGGGNLAADPTPARAKRVEEKDKSKVGEAIQQLRKELHPHIWETWVRPARAAGRKKNLLVGLPNGRFMRVWNDLDLKARLEDRLGEQISLLATEK